MTRREFQLIAFALKRCHAPLFVVESLADVLRTRNPRFDHGRFMHEAGITPTPQHHHRRPSGGRLGLHHHVSNQHFPEENSTRARGE